ncbi:Plasmodium exported protein, unknown function [Plasmodium malariae]|uniref:PIR Superfamily Protein n=1 Tax=Plasmodium malariae TaxID=5858 RepID=A0A1D3JKG4_PLAMA|nr:Plasmodium exported protein, unknown function [Plasmodium malariae]SBT87043.1 Plasmodium exported protein, unknown function [Plasmodium malariae]
MKQNFRSFFFVKIFAFNILIWLWNYNNNACDCGKLMYNKCKLNGYSDLTSNRILSDCSIDVKLTADISCDEAYAKLLGVKRDISINDKCSKSQRKIIKEILLKKEERNKLYKKKKTLLNRMDTFFEKKIYNQLDYIDKIKNNMEINEKNARRMINRKVLLEVSPPFSVLLSSFIVLILCFLCAVLKIDEVSSDTVTTPLIPNEVLIVFSVFLIFMTTLIILGIIYTSIKCEKYKRLKVNNSKICYNIVNFVGNKHIK